jgi:membrane associated rhomboid family serine protease
VFPIRDLNPTHGYTYLTLLIIVANLAVFFLWQPFGQGAEAEVEFLYRQAIVACELIEQRPLTLVELASGNCLQSPAGAAIFPDKNVWLAVLTSMFLHANLIHLAGNMWFLWIFGDNVEDRFGHLGFLAVYFLAGIAGTVGFVLSRPTEVTPLIGASGAVAGVLGAYLVLFPWRPVLAFAGFFLLPVPAALFIGLWVVGQFLVVDASVAWEAHVYGFAAGVVLAIALRPFLNRHARRR